MKVSRSTSYAIMALGYFARHSDEGLILSNDISDKYNIPLDYLLKILLQLVKAKILHSKRGPGGGFSLARSLKKVSMLEVIEAVEGPIVSNLKITVLAPREKFGAKAEAVFVKALVQAKKVFAETKMGDIF